MATKHDEFNTYVYAFSKSELQEVIDALAYVGKHTLAYEIGDQAGISPEDWEGLDGDNDTIASLTFDIDTSGVKQATKDLAELESAARNLADAYDRLHEAQLGPVEYHGPSGLAESILEALNEASRVGSVVIDRGGK